MARNSLKTTLACGGALAALTLAMTTAAAAQQSPAANAETQAPATAGQNDAPTPGAQDASGMPNAPATKVPADPDASTATLKSAESNAPAGETAAGGDIVVTGSRVANGFRTPTPVTMASSEQLRETAPTNLADGLNQLPVFSGSTKTSSPSTTNSRGGSSGQNLLNLRGLGAQRTLVLLDGRRLPATNSGGSVDINILPQGLVSRVDVVTGGASAAYGSDAVAGVVNFVLDTKLKGFKAEALGGISTHGDLPSAGGRVPMARRRWTTGCTSSPVPIISIRRACAPTSAPNATGSMTMRGRSSIPSAAHCRAT